MKRINTLILSAGRRVELVNLFKEALNEEGLEGKVFAGDLSDMAPALYFADFGFNLPRINSANYIEEIINKANQYDIDLIVPTIDTELLILAEKKDEIERNTRAKVLISDLKVIEICRDKIKTQNFLEQNNFMVPKKHNIEDINEKTVFPLFIKPLDGSSSQNIFKVNSFEEFKLYSSIVKNPIIQDFMQGEEYTVDVFLDFSSKVITVVPRLRIAVRGGEISQGKIVKDKVIISEVIRLMEILKPIGHITVQLMKTSKGIEFIEINPRFGGGAPMSIMSGANSCKNLLKLLLGDKLEYNENYQENEVYLRFDSSIKISDKK